MSTPKDTHEILIIGAHHAGINTAHYLLRHVLPSLSKLTPSTSYHITIVSPNVEFFWNIAAPRYLLGEHLIPTKKIFLPIASAFKAYDPAQFTSIVGKAIALDPKTHTVKVSTRDGNQDLRYATLVIASGTSYTSPLWAINDNEDVTKAEFSSVRKSLQAAKSVLIAGGGAIGVETSGEVASQLPNVDLVLLSGSARLLPRLLAANSAAAEGRLKALGVNTIHDLRVTSNSKNANGSTTLILSDGSSRIVDVYIDATGGKPNSSFLPPAWLNSTGHVLTDDKTMRATATGTEGIYAIGDVASYSDGGVLAVVNAVAALGTSIGIDIAKAAGRENVFTQKVYKPMKDSQFVPTGPKGGVGQLFGWRIPSLMVWAMKSRGFLVHMAQGAVDGGNHVKP